jgi:hypothetical protein
MWSCNSSGGALRARLEPAGGRYAEFLLNPHGERERRSADAVDEVISVGARDTDPDEGRDALLL